MSAQRFGVRTESVPPDSAGRQKQRKEQRGQVYVPNTQLRRTELAQRIPPHVFPGRIVDLIRRIAALTAVPSGSARPIVHRPETKKGGAPRLPPSIYIPDRGLRQDARASLESPPCRSGRKRGKPDDAR